MLDPLKFKQPLWLDIGAGNVKIDGFTTVDIVTDVDIQATMWDIPLPDGCVDVIQSLNSLEHVGKNDVVPTLREWHRLLKVGGEVHIFTPDLEWSCQTWLKYPGADWTLDILFGNQKHPGEYHLTGFTPKILWDYFVASSTEENGGWFIKTCTYMEGFVEESPSANEGYINLKAQQRMIVVEATKVGA